MSNLLMSILLFSGSSDLPAPVAASSDPDTPTKELDSILQDLMGMGEGEGVSTLSHNK